MIVTRRQEDVKDQCMEYSTGNFDGFGKKQKSNLFMIYSKSNGIYQWNINNQ
jgi:hypothetical protein